MIVKVIKKNEDKQIFDDDINLEWMLKNLKRKIYKKMY